MIGNGHVARGGTGMASAEVKDFGAPDEVRTFERRGRAGGHRRRPGRPSDGGARLEVEHPSQGGGRHRAVRAPHFQYVLQGTVHVVMADTELDIGPGQVAVLPPGHDAWVVGDEPVVTVDWAGASKWRGLAGRGSDSRQRRAVAPVRPPSS